MKERYDVTCVNCGHEFLAAPSLAMRGFELNTGFASCPKCGEHLHLEISPDIEGDKMISIRHAEHIAAI